MLFHNPFDSRKVLKPDPAEVRLQSVELRRLWNLKFSAAFSKPLLLFNKEITTMGRGRKAKTQKMKNRANQKKKKLRERKRADAKRQAKRR